MKLNGNLRCLVHFNLIEEEMRHKKINHYNERIPKSTRILYRDYLRINLGRFATLSDLLDELYRKGYWVELTPFYTFAFNDRMGVMVKIWKKDDENCIWNCIYDEEKAYNWKKDEGYGSSFWYALENKILRRIGEYETRKEPKTE